MAKSRITITLEVGIRADKFTPALVLTASDVVDWRGYYFEIEGKDRKPLYLGFNAESSTRCRVFFRCPQEQPVFASVFHQEIERLEHIVVSEVDTAITNAKNSTSDFLVDLLRSRFSVLRRMAGATDDPVVIRGASGNDTMMQTERLILSDEDRAEEEISTSSSSTTHNDKKKATKPISVYVHPEYHNDERNKHNQPFRIALKATQKIDWNLVTVSLTSKEGRNIVVEAGRNPNLALSRTVRFVPVLAEQPMTLTATSDNLSLRLRPHNDYTESVQSESDTRMSIDMTRVTHSPLLVQQLREMGILPPVSHKRPRETLSPKRSESASITESPKKIKRVEPSETTPRGDPFVPTPQEFRRIADEGMKRYVQRVVEHVKTTLTTNPTAAAVDFDLPTPEIAAKVAHYFEMFGNNVQVHGVTFRYLF